jgi:hypothetical protein
MIYYINMDQGIIKAMIYNIQGLQCKYDDVMRIMQENQISWAFLCETWLRCTGDGTQRPWESSNNTLAALIDGITNVTGVGRAIRGLALIINPATGFKRSDISEIYRDAASSCYGVWQVRHTLFIGMYLPPSLTNEQVERTLQEAIGRIPLDKRDWPVFVGGDLNANFSHLGRHTDNQRGRVIKRVLADQGMKLIEPM